MFRLIGIYNYTVILTYLSLVSAIVGIVLSSGGNFTASVACLMLSGLCDAFDGTVARSKKDRTEDEKAFGIQIDSLCDVISFGVFPAVLCYHLGADGILGTACMCIYVLCAVIRLAFFNVLEASRQSKEGGCNKSYRGLPVTTISMIFPVFYQLRFLVSEAAFTVLLDLLLLLTAYLFVLDFPVKKPSLHKFFTKKM